MLFLLKNTEQKMYVFAFSKPSLVNFDLKSFQ